MVVNTNFNFTDTGYNQVDIFEEYANVRCKFSDGKHEYIVPGSLLTYPFDLD
jgi:hypothetical protein